MTPATPPASKGRRSSRSSYIFDEGFGQGKEHDAPQTPHKGSQSNAPVTPSTTKPFKHAIPTLLAPTIGTYAKSPFKGFNSPEYTPQNQRSKNRPLFFEPPKELQNVSRVLFPPSEGETKDSSSILETGQSLLLPPRRPTSARRRLSNEFDREAEEKSTRVPHKLSKQVPGTPSHKVVTFDMAQEWHNPAQDINRSLENNSDSDSDSDADILIEQKPLKNPFQSSEVLDEHAFQERKERLLQENSDIEDVITYVNKKGEVVRRRHLSENEKKAYKPRRLFAEELKVLETKQKEDRDSEL